MVNAYLDETGFSITDTVVFAGVVINTVVPAEIVIDGTVVPVVDNAMDPEVPPQQVPSPRRVPAKLKRFYEHVRKIWETTVTFRTGRLK